jgi:alpha-D-ribose 1-methylphosphonate 5-triphosphate diphosphatase
MNSPFSSTETPDGPAGTPGGALTLANAKLVLEDQVLEGALCIEDGVICDLTEGCEVPAGAIDCGGDYLLPGLVELHTDNLERHIEPRPEVGWPHLPALIAHDAELASTGITTVFDALRVGSHHRDKTGRAPYARKLVTELLEARARGILKISHYIHLRAEICSETLLAEFADFSPEDRIGIVSLMDHTPGQRQFRDLEKLRVYWGKKRSMSDTEFEEHVVLRKGLQKRYGSAHEAGTVAEAARLGAVLASHDDTTAEQVATSQRNGVHFAEFPTTLEAAEACRAHGIAIMMGGPNIVRGASHSGNASAEDLARAGLLDIVSSDYVPASLLLSAFQLAALWGDMPRAVACVTRNAAQAAGLRDRGVLAPGLRGDVIRVRQVGQVPFLRGVWSAGQQVA